MGLIQRRTNLTLGSIGSTKLITIGSNEIKFMIDTGFVAIEVTNLSANPIFYGGTGVTTSSGGILTANGAKFWDNVSDDFTLYFVSNAIASSSQVVIQEYTGE